MRSLATIALLLFVSLSTYAHAAKPCEELKADIAKKLEANGVKTYTLEIVAKDKDAEGKVVGTCEGGTKKIVYSKTSTPDKAPETKTSKP